MKSLDELKNHQSQILLAEIAGFLHNLGKLNSKFIHKSSSGSSINYKYDIVLPVSDFLPPLQSDRLIRSKQGKELARLLCDENIWGNAAGIAKQFKARLTGNAKAVGSTREKINQVAKQLLSCGAQSFQVAEVKNRLASAVKLAELCQIAVPAACDDLDHLKKDGRQRAYLKNTELEILGAKVSLGELITLMWEQYHGFSDGQQLEPTLEFWTQRNATLQRYLITAHGVISDIEKELPGDTQQPSPPFTASAFGYEPKRNRIKVGKVDRRRDSWLTQLIQLTLSCLSEQDPKRHTELRKTIIGVTCTYLLRGLGETRRPLNDVTLWDYVSTISTLFKAAIAKAVIENQLGAALLERRSRVVRQPSARDSERYDYA